MFYLSQEDWSPRFGKAFFTVKLTSRATFSSPPPSKNGNQDSDSYLKRGNISFPATYYNVSVHCDRQEYTLQRRYSQFRSLYDQIVANPVVKTLDRIAFPPKTCFFQSIDHEFLDVRQDELLSFLDTILKSGYTDLPCVKEFLDLRRLS